MSEFFDELITGLNEAVAIERGELNGRITVTDGILQGFRTEGKEDVISKLLDANAITVEQIAAVLKLPISEVKEIGKKKSIDTDFYCKKYSFRINRFFLICIIT